MGSIEVAEKMDSMKEAAVLIANRLSKYRRKEFLIRTKLAIVVLENVIEKFQEEVRETGEVFKWEK